MSPSLLSALFVQLGLVASPITITEVGAAREGERLAITIKADAAIEPEAATPKLTTDGHLYLYVRDARVTEGNRAWGDGPAEIRAHRHRHQVELVVPLGQDGCRGAVEVVKSPGGLRALVSCDEDAPRTLRRSPPAPAPALASAAAPRAAATVEPKVSSKTAAKMAVKPEALVRAPEREAVALKAALVLQPPPVARDSPAKTSQVTEAVASQTAARTPTPTPTPTPTELAPAGIASAATPTAIATPSGGLPALQTVQSSSAGGRSSGVVLAGFLLCGLAGGAFVFARRRAKGSRYVTILETASLGPKRAIIVARIGDATMILGLSEAGITVLQSSTEATERGAGRSVLASLGGSRGSLAGDCEPELARPGASGGATDKSDDRHGRDADDDADGDTADIAGAGPGHDDQLADLDEPAAQGGLLARFFKPAANANGSSSAQSFESLLEDSLEDQELRRKLSLGLAGENPVSAAAPVGAADALTHAARTGAEMAFGGGGSSAVKIFLLVTALSFASSLVLSVTSFTRIIIVLSFLRQALGTPQLPPNQVLAGLSLFLTLFIMAPTFGKLHHDALGPFLDDKITAAEAMERGQGPLRDWMLKQTRDDDLRLFFEVSGQPRPARSEALPMTVVIPAFMVSELGTAFRMGLYLFIPMLLVDVLIASVLMSLGMMMVPPQMISLPLKIGIFLLAGGWHLVVSSLVRSFG